jgi:hypothetical protein
VGDAVNLVGSLTTVQIFTLEMSYNSRKTGRMKTLLTIFTLVFTVMFSSTSYADWTKLGENVSGNTFYVDFERIRKHGGYVYWWDLIDYLKPTKFSNLSTEIYNQGDCKLFRYKGLSYIHHKQPMGRGTGDSKSPKNPEWKYPPPDSVIEGALKKICSR